MSLSIRITRDREKTRKRLLHAGTNLFSRIGFHGASVDEIVTSARVNKRMLYHYFKDKKGLYRAVLADQWNGLQDWLDKETQDQNAKLESSKGPNSRLLKTLELFFDYLASHPEFTRLLTWEGLMGGTTSNSLWTEIREPLFEKINEALKTAQVKNKLNPKLDPAHLMISFMGAVSFYFAYAPSLKGMVRHDPLSPAGLAERKSQILMLFEELLT